METMTQHFKKRKSRTSSAPTTPRRAAAAAACSASSEGKAMMPPSAPTPEGASLAAALTALKVSLKRELDSFIPPTPVASPVHNRATKRARFDFAVVMPDLADDTECRPKATPLPKLKTGTFLSVSSQLKKELERRTRRPIGAEREQRLRRRRQQLSYFAIASAFHRAAHEPVASMRCHGEDQSSNGKKVSQLWYLGVILSIVGSVCTNLGVNLQKYSFMREAKRSIHPVIYPALSGIIGAQSELFAKSAIELIKTTVGGTNQFATFGTYAITLSMFTCIFLQIHWLAHGLQSFDAVFVVPVFQCFFISVSIFGGGVYFKDFSNMSSMALGMFFFGAVVTLSGVFLLSQREMNKLPPNGKFRACVKAVIFIKRVQKARKMEYRWRQPVGLVADIVSSSCLAKSSTRPTPPMKLAKSSVLPIDSSNASMAKIVVKPTELATTL
ncbi:hypothetical protein P43SY_009438 [Pythium insidiosum]|uniref:Magnesium transporter n=1 Tax=Pythium insidiosum TaxID=114742 RepID=A0AAD5M5S3_PYTIN|nr:hypothetical protein P43SY_009438 [Pythium insidiosum]